MLSSVHRLTFSVSTRNWNYRILWNQTGALTGSRRILLSRLTAGVSDRARGKIPSSTCGISVTSPSLFPRLRRTRAHLAQPTTSRALSSSTNQEHGTLRSKLKLFETPRDVHTLLVVQPEYKSGVVENPYVPAERKLEEAVSLAEAITGWSIHAQRIDAVRKPHSRTFFGKGKIAELQEAVKGLPVTGVFVDVPHLTPVQHKVLEEIFERDVFDRFSIVLRIFKERARTKEAKIQVELAEIPYLRAHLMEEEGHFDQQRGGSGSRGGGGETHLVAAKRNLHQREVHLKQELKHIHQRHQVTGVQRTKHHMPIVAIVGYTNAGKTTLIKALTKDESMRPEDMLFATLDTTMHAGRLPCGLKVLYVDTIGFISDLPHDLVESFSSTLDDVVHADLLVHVRDQSHPQSYAQKANVLKVLTQLDLKPGLIERMVEVVNKIDKVDTEPDTTDNAIPISALREEGLPDLLQQIEQKVLQVTKRKFWRVIVPADGPELSWLYHEAEATVCDVMPARPADRPSGGHRDTDEASDKHPSGNKHTDYLSVKAILTEAAQGKFQASFGNSVKMTEIEVHYH